MLLAMCNGITENINNTKYILQVYYRIFVC